VRLNDFFESSRSGEVVTAGAFTRARAKLKHNLFIDLNISAFKDKYYSSDDHKRFKGYRLLSIDGSKLRLPDSGEVREKFGIIKMRTKNMSGYYTGALCSVLYDVLNEIVIDSQLEKARASERDLAHRHLSSTREKDLILIDRGYLGYKLFSTIISQKADFIARCHNNTFKEVDDFILNTKQKDVIVEFSPYRKLKAEIEEDKLPTLIRVRLVKIILSSGELEILATSLLDKKLFPLEELEELYAMRWKVETFYDRIKNKLCVENFSGKTIESIKQDFYSTILITNIESLFAEEAQEILDNPKRKSLYKKKVNKAISYRIIKNSILDIVLSSNLELTEEMDEELKRLFILNPIPIRPNRRFPRDKSEKRSLHYRIRVKKDGI